MIRRILSLAAAGVSLFVDGLFGFGGYPEHDILKRDNQPEGGTRHD